MQLLPWCALLFSLLVCGETCENSLEEYLFVIKNSLIVERDMETLGKCDADYRDIASHLPHLQTLINHHLSHSFQYMSMSSHFGRDVINRKGFQKLFRKLSDDSWEESLELLGHVIKRGGHLMPEASAEGLRVQMPAGRNYSQPELMALGRALDLTKLLAGETVDLHQQITGMCISSCDPELAEFLQSKLMPEQTTTIRELSGHVTTLRVMMGGEERDLGLNLFDESLL